jgi:hypothetical protein
VVRQGEEKRLRRRGRKPPKTHYMLRLCNDGRGNTIRQGLSEKSVRLVHSFPKAPIAHESIAVIRRVCILPYPRILRHDNNAF